MSSVCDINRHEIRDKAGPTTAAQRRNSAAKLRPSTPPPPDWVSEREREQASQPAMCVSDLIPSVWSVLEAHAATSQKDAAVTDSKQRRAAHRSHQYWWSVLAQTVF